MTKPPRHLFRFRPLIGDGIFERELHALQNSFLYAPSFLDMNDPMEAFYETGGYGDAIMDHLLGPGKSVSDIYKMFSDQFDRAGLVSFSSSVDDLPLWAYYGSSFAGMCLEFDTEQLAIGDFRGEQIYKVDYVNEAPAPIQLVDIVPRNLERTVPLIFTRKRSEWAHEKEWRFLVGEVGTKHYIDTALVRIYLGPRIDKDHERQICELLKRRPVEILKAEIHGFDMKYRLLQTACPLDECETVGSQGYDLPSLRSDVAEFENFLACSIDQFDDVVRELAKNPNCEIVEHYDVSVNNPGVLYIFATYRLRNGNDVLIKRYLDEHLNIVER